MGWRLQGWLSVIGQTLTLRKPQLVFTHNRRKYSSCHIRARGGCSHCLLMSQSKTHLKTAKREWAANERMRKRELRYTKVNTNNSNSQWHFYCKPTMRRSNFSDTFSGVCNSFQLLNTTYFSASSHQNSESGCVCVCCWFSVCVFRCVCVCRNAQPSPAPQNCV